MLRPIPKLVCGLAVALLATSGCQEKKTPVQQEGQEAAADYGFDYTEPADTGYKATPTYDNYAATGADGGLTTEGDTQTATPAGTRVHVVQPKETLSSIALKYYGRRNWRKIYEANKDQISDPNVIHPGMKLIIP
jgi:nucleoid-associated protein YgaU